MSGRPLGLDPRQRATPAHGAECDRLLDLDRLDAERWARDAEALARDADTLAAVAAHDPFLAAALAELPRRQRVDVLAGVVDDEVDVLLGAICGSEWQRRLAQAIAETGRDAPEERQ